jgi:hypothetical protein
MNDPTTDKSGKPAIVIIAAILNFLSTVTFLALAAFSALAIVYGAVWGLDEVVSRQMSQFAPSPNYSYGLAAVFGVATAVLLAFAVFFLVIGVGLLRGRKYGWYLQVAMSILGLVSLPLGFVTGALALPIGALLNIVILVMFFQARVRAHFGI